MKQILHIRASHLKESSCMRRFYWQAVSNYAAPLSMNDVEFGSAIHEFIKVMRTSGGNYGLAVKAAQERYAVPCEMKSNKKYMTPDYLTKACMQLWQQWIANDEYETIVVNGQPLVEQKFAYPYYADNDIEVMLVGTIDDICRSKETGSPALRDYKTTSMFDKSGYLASYALSPQLMFYRLVLEYYARTYPDSLFGQLHKENARCFIDGIFCAGAAKPVEFARSEIFCFPETQMREFEQLVHERIMNLVKYAKAQLLPPREGMINGACATVYGACKFFNACIQSDETGTQHTLNRYFVQKEYNQ